MFCLHIAAKRYTKDHEAVIFDDETKIGTITITDYAQESLGDVVFVELPTVGTAISQGGTVIVAIGWTPRSLCIQKRLAP